MEENWMPVAHAKPISRQRVAWVIFLWFGGLGALVFTVFDGIAGWPFLDSVFHGFGLGLALGLTFLCTYLLASKGQTLAEPGTESELEEIMIAAGYKSPRITISSTDAPRPALVGSALLIPKRVRETWSLPALRWWIQVESKAFDTSGWVHGSLLVILVLASILLGGGRRWHSNLLLVAAAVTIATGFLWVALKDRRRILAIDRELTKTDTDLLAAKEALGNVYFAQLDRPWFNRFTVSATFVKHRADALGITLERGSHVGSDSRVAS